MMETRHLTGPCPSLPPPNHEDPQSKGIDEVDSVNHVFELLWEQKNESNVTARIAMVLVLLNVQNL